MVTPTLADALWPRFPSLRPEDGARPESVVCIEKDLRPRVFISLWAKSKGRERHATQCSGNAEHQRQRETFLEGGSASGL